jgi:undecaprenyl diphosphate synthase
MTVSNNLNLPRHVAIIMDGNGRWAKSRGLPRIAGHHKGAEAVRTTVTAARERGIEILTLFAFSTQNWSRPSPEVSALMALLFNYINSERSTILDNNIRLTTIGQTDLLPSAPRKALEELMEVSSGNDGMTLCLSLSYGGQEEIAAVARSLAQKAVAGEIDPSSIDTELIGKSLWSTDLGPVDLMIRTSGELRISNFLLWSLAYSELYFTDKKWPDFNEACLDEALETYGLRQRRFGKVK